MKRIFYLIIFSLPLTLLGQSEKVFVVTDSTFAEGLSTLANDWHYQKGDDPAWANADFDDSAWPVKSYFNLNMLNEKTAIAEKNEIVWFRKRIKADSSLKEELVIQVIQQGASEIYLDGQLIHKFGTVSSNPDEIKNVDPRGNFLSFPSLNGEEQVLAVRYVNSQYKYARNQRYSNSNGFVQISMTTKRFAKLWQITTITDSTVVDKWSGLYHYWRYQKGDNTAWANPEFDDSSWSQFSRANLNMPDGDQAIANRGDIVWFRKRIKADSSLSKTIVLNIFQYGASEIYLDGKLIHQLGKVSSDLDEVIYHNPSRQVLQLPLIKGKAQVLAVRYINAQHQFPLFADTNGYIRITVSSLSNANSRDVEKNYRIAANIQQENNFYITLGIAILMFIIFTSFYLFFPKEKINGYFALSILFLIFFIIGVIWELDNTGADFWISFSYDANILISSIVLLYCSYRIMPQPIDSVYKTVSFLGLIAIGCLFLDKNAAITWALLLYVAIIRLTVKSWNNNRAASILFMSSSFIGLLYWAIILLRRIGLSQLYLEEYMPFTFMIIPLTLAIYLGYAFGRRSQELRLNLERVQKLSLEKESILSSQNETLEKQVNERTSELNQSLENLKSTQSQLIQSEKMASLGELTAGIAHEIQNPLNFVNNFSEVSAELVEEMNEELEEGNLEDVKEISADLKQNLEKINHHGNRAGDIVKGMLQHSRSSSGAKEPTDINALADEYLRLAYHGLRAKDKSFNATMLTEFDESIEKVNIIPQDIGRVILNLITNAFYTVSSAASAKVGSDYTPTVSVSTKKEDDKILLSVKDNGNGIPEKVLDKIFQPFFTTKPTGQGTGLGLSLSYDIVKAHGGDIKIETVNNEGLDSAEAGSEFIISLPYK